MADLVKKIRTDSGDLQIDYKALANLPDLKNMFSNPNLLINSDFRNPVNQRGKTSYTGTGSDIYYTIDRWGIINGLIVTVQDNSLKLQVGSNDAYSGKLKQMFENALPSDFYTLSVKVKSNTNNVPITNFGTISAGFTGIYSHTTSLKLALSEIEMFIAPGATIEIEWIKLEQGSIATPFTTRLFAEELMMCQRYYRAFRRIPIYTTSTSGVSYMLPIQFGIPMRETQKITLLEILNSSAAVQSDVSVTNCLSGPYNAQILQLSKSIGQYGFATMTFDAEIY